MEILDLYKLDLHSLSLISSSRSHPCPPWVLASYVVFFDVFRSFAILFGAFSDDLAISWYMFHRLLGWTYCFDLSLLVGAGSAFEEAVVALHCVL